MKKNINNIYNKTKQIMHKMLLRLQGIIMSIIIATTSGIVVAFRSYKINEKVEEQKVEETIKKNLNNINLGMSNNYINELFGSPIVKDESYYKTDEGEQDVLITSCYKLGECVLLCLYHKESIVAFVIVVNDKNIYQTPNTRFSKSFNLLDFTYADFYKEFEDAEYISGNLPANNDDFAYYFEIYYGANSARYNSFIIGNYKDYNGLNKIDEFTNKSNELIRCGQNYRSKTNGNDIINYNYEQHYELRKQVYPNMFGIVSPSYIEKFAVVFDVAGSNSTFLFDDWINN